MNVHNYYQRSITKMVEKFKPTNVSQVIALACPGEEIPSTYPPYKQMQYRLTNGLPWYASLSVAKKLSQFSVGEEFRVCLREYAPGKTTLDVRPLARLDLAGGPRLEASAHPSNGAIQNNGNGNTNGHGNGHTPAPAFLMTGQSQGMLEQFIGVYEVLVAVEKYSDLKGRPVKFSSEDFRSTAISCYIQKSREGGR